MQLAPPDSFLRWLSIAPFSCWRRKHCAVRKHRSIPFGSICCRNGMIILTSKLNYSTHGIPSWLPDHNNTNSKLWRKQCRVNMCNYQNMFMLLVFEITRKRKQKTCIILFSVSECMFSPGCKIKATKANVGIQVFQSGLMNERNYLTHNITKHSAKRSVFQFQMFIMEFFVMSFLPFWRQKGKCLISIWAFLHRSKWYKINL